MLSSKPPLPPPWEESLLTSEFLRGCLPQLTVGGNNESARPTPNHWEPPGGTSVLVSFSPPSLCSPHLAAPMKAWMWRPPCLSPSSLQLLQGGVAQSYGWAHFRTPSSFERNPIIMTTYTRHSRSRRCLLVPPTKHQITLVNMNQKKNAFNKCNKYIHSFSCILFCFF